MLDWILIIICGIVGFFVCIKFLKWGIRCFSDGEIMNNFGFKEVIFPLLFLFWIILVVTGIYSIFLYRNEIFTPEILNAISEMEINVDALIKGLPALIPLLLLLLFSIFIIPIIFLIYYHKHKKDLKEQNIKNFKKIARTHFFMGLFSPILIPFIMGPKLILSFLISSPNNNNKRFTNSYTKITDSKGNVTYVDTIIDNETGYGSTKIEDSKGNKSYHTTHRN